MNNNNKIQNESNNKEYTDNIIQNVNSHILNKSELNPKFNINNNQLNNNILQNKSVKTLSLNVNKRIKLNFKRGRRQLVIDKTKNVSQDILNFNKNLNIVRNKFNTVNIKIIYN